MHTAILLIAHGSRRKEANDELLRLADSVRRRLPAAIVETAYLELAEPGIAEGIRRCLARGATQVRLVPYFLSPGMHVTQHLEEYRQRFEAENPGLQFTLAAPLGTHPGIVDIVLDVVEGGSSSDAAS